MFDQLLFGDAVARWLGRWSQPQLKGST